MIASTDKHTRDEIILIIIREGNEGIGVICTSIKQKLLFGGVTIEYQGALEQELRGFGDIRIGLNDANVSAARMQHESQILSDPPAASNDNTLRPMTRLDAKLLEKLIEKSSRPDHI
jgi:hypothetical protein